MLTDIMSNVIEKHDCEKNRNQNNYEIREEFNESNF